MKENFKKETFAKPKETKASDTKTDKETELVAEVKYDPQRKSWLGPVTGNKNTMKLTKAMTNREEQLKSQDQAKLQHNRKKVQGTITPDLNDDATIANNEDFMQSAEIEKPFTNSLQDAKTAKWGASVLPTDRSNVNFEKPVKKDATSSHFLSPSQQVIRLEQDLAKRDQEIALLRKQLEMAHRENDTMVEKLKGYSGKHYQDIVKENKQLRESYIRENRKALALEAEAKKKSNTKLQEMKYKDELEEKHAPDWQRSGGSCGKSPHPDVVIDIKYFKNK